MMCVGRPIPSRHQHISGKMLREIIRRAQLCLGLCQGSYAGDALIDARHEYDLLLGCSDFGGLDGDRVSHSASGPVFCLS